MEAYFHEAEVLGRTGVVWVTQLLRNQWFQSCHLGIMVMIRLSLTICLPFVPKKNVICVELNSTGQASHSRTTMGRLMQKRLLPILTPWRTSQTKRNQRR